VTKSMLRQGISERKGEGRDMPLNPVQEGIDAVVDKVESRSLRRKLLFSIGEPPNRVAREGRGMGGAGGKVLPNES